MSRFFVPSKDHQVDEEYICLSGDDSRFKGDTGSNFLGVHHPPSNEAFDAAEEVAGGPVFYAHKQGDYPVFRRRN